MSRVTIIIACFATLLDCSKRREHQDQAPEIQVQVQVPLDADMVARQGQGADTTKYEADTLTLTDQHKTEVFFDDLNIKVSLPNEHYIWSLGAVENTKQQLASLLGQLGLQHANVSYTNTAENGMHMSLRFKDGRSCSYIWARKHDDERITKSRIAHEQCHVIEGLSQSVYASFHQELKARAPQVHWSEFDEEQRCSVVEVMSLQAQGVPLNAISGSELIVRATVALAKPEQ